MASLESIIQGLEYLLENCRAWGIESLAVPPLGAGQGQLEWRVIGPTLYRYLNRMNISVELYAPYGTPHEELQIEFLEPADTSEMPSPDWIKPGWAVLVEILKRIDDEIYHWPIGRTIFQKIAYVATKEGLPTGLNYQKGSYGPFSPELNGVIARLMNNGLIQETRKGRMFEVSVGTTYSDARKAYAADLDRWESVVERVTDLFLRMNTDQAEIVATVLYTADVLEKGNKEIPTENDVLSAVMDWKQRRRPPLDEATVAYTIRNLAALSWLKVRASSDLPLPEEYELDY